VHASCWGSRPSLWRKTARKWQRCAKQSCCCCCCCCHLSHVRSPSPRAESLELEEEEELGPSRSCRDLRSSRSPTVTKCSRRPAVCLLAAANDPVLSTRRKKAELPPAPKSHPIPSHDGTRQYPCSLLRPLSLCYNCYLLFELLNHLYDNSVCCSIGIERVTPMTPPSLPSRQQNPSHPRIATCKLISSPGSSPIPKTL
jgi:hypothetical protein